MGSLGDILNVPSGDGDFPPTGKQSELVNRVFTIQDQREVQTKLGESHIVTVTFDGDEEQHEFWFGGVYAIKQLEALVLHEAFPARVKLVKMKVGQGDAYHLIEADGPDGPAPTPAPPQKPQEAAQWIPGLTDACSQWMRANGGSEGVQERAMNDGLPAEIYSALKVEDGGRITGWNLKGADEKRQEIVLVALRDDMAPESADELPFE